MRIRTPLAVATLVLVAGCSSGGADEQPESAPSAATTSASPTAYPTPEEAKPVDPCSLLPAKVWKPLVDPDKRRNVELTPTLESDFGPVARCRVLYGIDGATAVSWGYWLRPLDLQAVADEYGGERLDGLPGDGFGTHTLVSTDAYARVGGGQGFTVSVPEGFSFSTKGRTPMPQLRKALIALVRTIDYDMQRLDIDLPEACPSADDRLLRKAIGTVTHARGGLVHDTQRCDYVNDKTGASISAKVSVLSAQEFDFAYSFSRDNKGETERWIDPPPGPFTSAYRSPGDWSYDTLLPGSSTAVYVRGNQDTTGRTARERRGAFDARAFEVFGRSFSRSWAEDLKSS